MRMSYGHIDSENEHDSVRKIPALKGSLFLNVSFDNTYIGPQLRNNAESDPIIFHSDFSTTDNSAFRNINSQNNSSENTELSNNLFFNKSSEYDGKLTDNHYGGPNSWISSMLSTDRSEQLTDPIQSLDMMNMVSNLISNQETQSPNDLTSKEVVSGRREQGIPSTFLDKVMRTSSEKTKLNFEQYSEENKPTNSNYNSSTDNSLFFNNNNNVPLYSNLTQLSLTDERIENSFLDSSVPSRYGQNSQQWNPRDTSIDRSQQIYEQQMMQRQNLIKQYQHDKSVQSVFNSTTYSEGYIPTNKNIEFNPFQTSGSIVSHPIQSDNMNWNTSLNQDHSVSSSQPNTNALLNQTFQSYKIFPNVMENRNDSFIQSFPQSSSSDIVSHHFSKSFDKLESIQYQNYGEYQNNPLQQQQQQQQEYRKESMNKINIHLSQSSNESYEDTNLRAPVDTLDNVSQVELDQMSDSNSMLSSSQSQRYSYQSHMTNFSSPSQGSLHTSPLINHSKPKQASSPPRWSLPLSQEPSIGNAGSGSESLDIYNQQRYAQLGLGVAMARVVLDRNRISEDLSRPLYFNNLPNNSFSNSFANFTDNASPQISPQHSQSNEPLRAFNFELDTNQDAFTLSATAKDFKPAQLRVSLNEQDNSFQQKQSDSYSLRSSGNSIYGDSQSIFLRPEKYQEDLQSQPQPQYGSRIQSSSTKSTMRDVKFASVTRSQPFLPSGHGGYLYPRDSRVSKSTPNWNEEIDHETISPSHQQIQKIFSMEPDLSGFKSRTGSGIQMPSSASTHPSTSSMHMFNNQNNNSSSMSSPSNFNAATNLKGDRIPRNINLNPIVTSGDIYESAQGRMTGTPNSATNMNPQNNRGSAFGSQPFPKHANRNELVESPQSKSAYKQFFKAFRLKEKESIQSAFKYTTEALKWMPYNTLWKIKIEMADMCKRMNDIPAARRLYEEACALQPNASQCWLDRSKFEEDCGNLKESLRILTLGLQQSFNENLLTRAIKQHEKLHNISAARQMLSSLKRLPMDKTFKALYEGALLEVRAGRTNVAREIFKFLMEYNPWYGPIYHEAFNLEEKLSENGRPLKIIQRGLEALPKYGPLWFALLRIAEREDCAEETKYWWLGIPPKLTQLHAESKRAIDNISKELIWKIFFELAQSEERACEIVSIVKFHTSVTVPSATNKQLSHYRDELFGKVRLLMSNSVLSCPNNLRWKVWLLASRIEVSSGHLSKARKCLLQALREAPAKSKGQIYLECSRSEEYGNNLISARNTLTRACEDIKSEWKLPLELIQLEMRNDSVERAVKSVQNAVVRHPGAGRIWVLYIQISHRYEAIANIRNRENLNGKVKPESSDDSRVIIANKDDILLKSLLEVPKSGEVWCEGARCAMNPLVRYSFDLSSAQRNLNFAIQFTPQYGDTFVEYMKLELICQTLLPRVLSLLGIPFIPFVRQFLSNDPESDTSLIIEDMRYLEKLASSIDYPYTSFMSTELRDNRMHHIKSLASGSLEFPRIVDALSTVIVSSLQRRCNNADPNYGTNWFHCRISPILPPSKVLTFAQNEIIHDIIDTQALYNNAIFCFVITSLCNAKSSVSHIDKSYIGMSSKDDSRISLREHSLVSTLQDRKSDPLSLSVDSMHTAKKKNKDPIFSSNVSRFFEVTSAQHTDSVKSEIDDLNLDYLQSDNFASRMQREHQLIEDVIKYVGQQLNVENRQQKDQLIRFLTHPLKPSVVIDDSLTVTIGDFTTALMSVNRKIFESKLSDDERRKVLFGTDQISI